MNDVGTQIIRAGDLLEGPSSGDARRQLLQAGGLEKSQPQLRHRGKGRHGVPQAIERNLTDDRDLNGWELLNRDTGWPRT